MMRELELSKRTARMDLNRRPPVVMSEAERKAVDAALGSLPAYASLMFPSAKDEILGEMREVKWTAGEVAFEVGQPVANLYVVLEGSLHRGSYLNGNGVLTPGNVISRGSLFGEVALAHAYTTTARVVSENGEMEPVATRALAVNGETFKRIVRTRVHRARQLCTNVLNIVETFRLVPAESKELLLNALWSGSAAYRPGTAIAGSGFPRRCTWCSRARRRAAPNGTETTLGAGECFGEDWLLCDAQRERFAARDYETGCAYVAKTHAVTLAVTRTMLRRLWGATFDEHLRSRHEIAAAGSKAVSSRLIHKKGEKAFSSVPNSLSEWPASPAEAPRPAGTGATRESARFAASVHGGSLSRRERDETTQESPGRERDGAETLSLTRLRPRDGDGAASSVVVPRRPRKKHTSSFVSSVKKFTKKMKKMMGATSGSSSSKGGSASKEGSLTSASSGTSVAVASVAGDAARGSGRRADQGGQVAERRYASSALRDELFLDGEEEELPLPSRGERRRGDVRRRLRARPREEEDDASRAQHRRFFQDWRLGKIRVERVEPVKNIMLMDTSVTKRTYDATPESMGMSQAEFDASFRGGNHGGPKAKAPTRWTITLFAKQVAIKAGAHRVCVQSLEKTGRVEYSRRRGGWQRRRRRRRRRRRDARRGGGEGDGQGEDFATSTRRRTWCRNLESCVRCLGIRSSSACSTRFRPRRRCSS